MGQVRCVGGQVTSGPPAAATIVVRRTPEKAKKANGLGLQRFCSRNW